MVSRGPGPTSPPPSGRPIRLLVDARSLYASGLGRYLRSILERLLQDSRFGTFRLLGDVDQIAEFAAKRSVAERVEAVPYPCLHYSPATQRAWLQLRLGGKCVSDAVFFPHYDVPIYGVPRPTVVTVHDLIHFEVPEVYSGWRTRAAGFLLRRAVQQAARVLTVSECTRRDLVARWPGVERKVSVIPNGVDSFFHPEGEGAGPRGVEAGRFILCVGNRKPHKNHVAGVEVVARLRSAWPDLKLVVAGPAFPGPDRVRERAAQLGIADSVVELDHVTDRELRWLYSNCVALLFPSLYEGFGLPILEAMACGAAVVSSNRASLPEVVGDVGWLVDPYDHETMAAAVHTLLVDPVERKRRGDRGIERSARFGWDTAAARVADELVRVATGGGHQPARIDSASHRPVVAATMVK